MSGLIARRKLHENTAGDAELADEVLGIFLEQVDLWGKMLNAKDEPSRWADAAHTIKGAALGIGAEQLADACKVAEQAGRSDEPPSATKAAVLLNDIRDCLMPTLDEVAKIRHEISVSGSFRAS
ncbi:Hpt domain-containing protein [Ponticaulis profundi]|uniref:Hpt domain-containing protein n=1 Tax=Ponticaulis profundi TaxID=2665222 RepID=A0ABW1S686_9PROT